LKRTKKENWNFSELYGDSTFILRQLLRGLILGDFEGRPFVENGIDSGCLRGLTASNLVRRGK